MPLPTNKEVAAVLREIETLMVLLGEDEARARTYGRTSRLVERLADPAAERARAGTLTRVRGIGPRIQGVVGELAASGTVALRDDLAARVPEGVWDLLRVPGLGTRRVRALWRDLGVRSLDELRAAASDGRLAALPGFGARSAAKVLEGVALVQRSRGRVLLSTARELSERWIGELGAVRAAVTGPARRGEPVVDRIALVCVGEPVEVAGAERRGDLLVVPAGEHPEIRIRWTRPDGFARALFEQTGPAAHVEAVLARPGPPAPEGSEQEIYTARGLHYVPPERRHACDGTEPVPALVERERVQGLLHAHTRWSDGALSLEEMAAAAQERGYAYLGVTDHSRAAVYANGLSLERLREQGRAIQALNERAGSKVRILSGTEVDILPDGKLDYPDEVLAELDFVVASGHSSFEQDPETMTDRILGAVRNPHVDILGHATGRLLLRRDGYAVDVERVLEAAAEAGTMVELNANPWRLDLAPCHHARARELGVGVPICPDAHSAAGMDDVGWGVAAARHGGLTPADVPNCAGPDAFLEALRR